MTGTLTINTSGNDKIALRGTQSDPHTIWLGDSKGVRFWDSANGELMRITNTGKVGIGTTNQPINWMFKELFILQEV
jgi:hypothetical protein